MAIPDYSYHQPGKEGNKRSSFECSLPCLKFSLYCYNILLLMFGLAGLSVGLWTIIDRGQILSLLTSSVYHVSGGIIIVSGSIIILITVLGCCGISRERNKMILLYGCLLAITVLIQCTIGVTAYFYKEQVCNRRIHRFTYNKSTHLGSQRVSCKFEQVYQYWVWSGRIQSHNSRSGWSSNYF